MRGELCQCKLRTFIPWRPKIAHRISTVGQLSLTRASRQGVLYFSCMPGQRLSYLLYCDSQFSSNTISQGVGKIERDVDAVSSQSPHTRHFGYYYLLSHGINKQVLCVAVSCT